LLPIVVGNLLIIWEREQFVFRDILGTIQRVKTEKTLLILSTDLTSWGVSFNFTPAPPEQMLEKQEH
jgi:predicted Zn-dependent protease